ncbi:hypothetical protein OSCI_3400029 [Kamptonema sp. PCC 6506]|nr:hypothetical protein OSCI_3400029 [Kamptonema sp. PCC 6506]
MDYGKFNVREGQERAVNAKKEAAHEPMSRK